MESAHVNPDGPTHSEVNWKQMELMKGGVGGLPTKTRQAARGRKDDE